MPTAEAVGATVLQSSRQPQSSIKLQTCAAHCLQSLEVFEVHDGANVIAAQANRQGACT